MHLSRIAAAITLAAAGAAHADTSLLDSSMYATLSDTNAGVIGGVSFASASGNFITKTKSGISGLGVTGGRTNDEIDIRETITMSWVGGLKITSFSVGVLYNGPEFGDWAETAQVRAWNGDTMIGTGVLQVDATNNTLATFTGTGFGSVTNLSPATQNDGGAWKVDNPFGHAMVTKLEFTSLESTLCGTTSACTNQSDYTLSSVTAVPEPSAYAMMLAGLGALGFVARRRSPRA
jgi:PEP-CTERM motif